MFFGIEQRIFPFCLIIFRYLPNQLHIIHPVDMCGMMVMVKKIGIRESCSKSKRGC